MNAPWWPEEEVLFWEAFEDRFVVLSPGQGPGTRDLVRSDVGRRLLTRLRQHVAATYGDDPHALAAAARRL